MDYNIKKTNQEINSSAREIKRIRDKERKERTHRLVQKGALLEKYFDIADLDVEATENLLKKLAPAVKKARVQKKN